MSTVRHFAGDTQLQGVHERNGKLVGYVSKDDLHFVDGQGWQGYTAVERSVQYSKSPSRHECDARCLNATGRVMRCECACGGKNHGRGAFSCEKVAA